MKMSMTSLIYVLVSMGLVQASLISLRKPTNQSSIWRNYVSSNCVDGKYDKLCHTTLENSFWIVDLQGKFDVDHVVLHNRVDCCMDRIVGAVVELLSKSNEVLHLCGVFKEAKLKLEMSCGNKLAEKLRVRHLKKQYLHFTELDVYGEPNKGDRKLISREKPTTQSSIHLGLDSSLAVDGNYDDIIRNETLIYRNCFYTKDNKTAFWMVDLLGTFNIENVVLYNRMDCCSDRIKGAVVELLDSCGEVSHECGIITEAKSVYDISCGNNMAQKVRVRGTRPQTMHLCEIDVYGDPTPEYIGTISRGKPTYQSSTYFNHLSSNCVDGNYETLCHTLLDNSSSWTVDLLGKFNIDHVVLHNRVDCCSNRSIGVVIELLSKHEKLIHTCGTLSHSKPLYRVACNNKLAEKVRIRQTLKEYLHFTEIEVFEDSDVIQLDIISRGKPTSQTSTYAGTSSPTCVDGNYQTICHTLEEDRPSWTVDLQANFKIDHVVLYNRVDCCSARIIGTVVELLSISDEVLHQCGTIGEVISIADVSCRNKLARKIRVRNVGKQYLHFLEIDVFGDAVGKHLNIISRGKPTTQSSTYLVAFSSNCVDGNYETICHTLKNSGNYWIVDLQGKFNIDHVYLHNRIDCCSDRAIGLVIELLSKYDDVLHVCGTISTVKTSYDISCNNEVATKVRVRHLQNEYLQFNELDIFGEPAKSSKG